jgi:hypothetical protein
MYLREKLRGRKVRALAVKKKIEKPKAKPKSPGSAEPKTRSPREELTREKLEELRRKLQRKFH